MEREMEEKQVEQTISELKEASEYLSSRLGELERRLTGVLQDAPSVEVATEKTDPGLVTIAFRIYEVKQHISAEARRIENIMERLELNG